MSRTGTSLENKFALGLLLLADEELVERSMIAQDTGNSRSSLFSMIMIFDKESAQLVDNLFFCPFTNTITFLYAKNQITSAFRYCLVVDLLRYRVIAKPIELSRS